MRTINKILFCVLAVSQAALLEVRAGSEGPSEGGSGESSNSQSVVSQGKTELRKGNYGKAEKLLSSSLQARREGPGAPEALFYRGEALRALKMYEKALKCYNEVLKKHPDTSLMKRALQRKYMIGMAFLQGEAHRYFLGLIPYNSSAFGVRILDKLVQDYPSEDFSDDALYTIANHYFRREKWAEAQPVFKRLISSYPRSEWVPTAYFCLGKAVSREIKGYRYDPSPIREARRYMKRFLEKREIGAEAEEARKCIVELRNLEARHYLYIARFYLRDGNQEGARLYLRRAIGRGRALDGKLTEAAVEARSVLAGLTQAG